MAFVPPLPTRYALIKVTAGLPGDATIDAAWMKDEDPLPLTVCDAANAGTPKLRRRRGTAKRPVKLLLFCLAISRINVFFFHSFMYRSLRSSMRFPHCPLSQP
jgi:hypothetical protein